jgi:hypothetical protein
MLLKGNTLAMFLQCIIKFYPSINSVVAMAKQKAESAT